MKQNAFNNFQYNYDKIFLELISCIIQKIIEASKNNLK